MPKSCKNCGVNFEVTAEDLAFYDKVSPEINGVKYTIPEPTHCPDCRQQRRLSFRNERNLYHRKCNFCNKGVISVYSPDSKCVVYCSSCWWSENWSPLQHGKEFDFSRTFFEQFAELLQDVPVISNMVWKSENCEYNAFCDTSKNCYMSCRLAKCEDILYSYLSYNCKSCVDCMNIYDSQYCYEVVDCWNCYNCKFSQKCKNCSDCLYCYDCIGSKNCFGSVGLRNAEYVFFNKQCTPEEYQENVSKYFNLGYQENINLRSEFYDKYLLNYPVNALNITNSINVIGNNIVDSQNVYWGFEVESCNDYRYGWGGVECRDQIDSSFSFATEKGCEITSSARSNGLYFSLVGVDSSNVLYSMYTFNNTNDCFGCISLKKNQYCILNKQYTKEEYEVLVPRIIQHMQKTGEWGEYFPANISPFAYNETEANRYFPLSKEDVSKCGLVWKEDDKHNIYQGTIFEIPLNIDNVSDDILKQILTCRNCSKNYKLNQQELKFYRDFKLPVPTNCHDCRYKCRQSIANLKNLWIRNCTNCNSQTYSVYSNEYQGKVYCEKCYLEAVY
jgi:hypothetical protein